MSENRLRPERPDQSDDANGPVKFSFLGAETVATPYKLVVHDWPVVRAGMIAVGPAYVDTETSSA